MPRRIPNYRCFKPKNLGLIIIDGTQPGVVYCLQPGTTNRASAAEAGPYTGIVPVVHRKTRPCTEYLFTIGTDLENNPNCLLTRSTEGLRLTQSSLLRSRLLLSLIIRPARWATAGVVGVSGISGDPSLAGESR